MEQFRSQGMRRFECPPPRSVPSHACLQLRTGSPACCTDPRHQAAIDGRIAAGDPGRLSGAIYSLDSGPLLVIHGNATIIEDTAAESFSDPRLRHQSKSNSQSIHIFDANPILGLQMNPLHSLIPFCLDWPGARQLLDISQ
jgi:hypothetical protein